MAEITSTRNPRVREIAGLHRARGRRESGRHLVEGPRAVTEAMAAGVIEEVFVTASADHELTLPVDVVVTHVSDHVMERLTDASTPQGIVAVARTVTAPLEDVVDAGLLLVLHEVADPGNAGTILRTADAAGARGVVLTTGSVDVFGPKCVRSAVGSTYHLPISVDAAFTDVVAACGAAGQRVVALDGAGARSVFDLEETGDAVALVLGNEAHGLPADVVEVVDEVVAVPIHGRAESLNVAAAAAVALYAAARGLRRSG